MFDVFTDSQIVDFWPPRLMLYIWYRADTTVGGVPLSTYSISTVVNVPEFNFALGD